MGKNPQEPEMPGREHSPGRHRGSPCVEVTREEFRLVGDGLAGDSQHQ